MFQLVLGARAVFQVTFHFYYQHTSWLNLRQWLTWNMAPSCTWPWGWSKTWIVWAQGMFQWASWSLEMDFMHLQLFVEAEAWSTKAGLVPTVDLSCSRLVCNGAGGGACCCGSSPPFSCAAGRSSWKLFVSHNYGMLEDCRWGENNWRSRLTSCKNRSRKW